MKYREKLDKKYTYLALIVCLVLMFVSCAYTFFSEITLNTSVNAWSSHTESPVDVGNNTYEIYTAEQLAGFAKAVNDGNTYSGKTIVLKNNIDLADHTWTPIGDSSHKFSGTFDGKKFAIVNMNINSSKMHVGLFGHAENARIQNVSLSGTVQAASNYVGGLCGYAKSLTVDGCIINVTVINDKKKIGECGGILGWSLGNVTIQNCQNVGAVSACGYVGGILGKGEATIYNCSNLGMITGTSQSTSIGGIVGEGTTNISFCSNYGNIIAETAWGSLGGITGSGGTISYCYSLAEKVSSPKESDPFLLRGEAGGISGGGGTISNCYSCSQIEAYSMSYNLTSQSIAIGSLYSKIMTGHDQDPISPGGSITNCYNLQKMEFNKDTFPCLVYVADITLPAASKYDSDFTSHLGYYPNGKFVITSGGTKNKELTSGTDYTILSNYGLIYDTYTAASPKSAPFGNGFGAVQYGGDEEYKYEEKMKTVTICPKVVNGVPTFEVKSEVWVYQYKDNYTTELVNKKTVTLATVTGGTNTITYNGTYKSSNQDLYNSLDKNYWGMDKEGKINGGRPFLKSQYWIAG